MPATHASRPRHARLFELIRQQDIAEIATVGDMHVVDPVSAWQWRERAHRSLGLPPTQLHLRDALRRPVWQRFRQTAG